MRRTAVFSSFFLLSTSRGVAELYFLLTLLVVALSPLGRGTACSRRRALRARPEKRRGNRHESIRTDRSMDQSNPPGAGGGGVVSACGGGFQNTRDREVCFFCEATRISSPALDAPPQKASRKGRQHLDFWLAAANTVYLIKLSTRTPRNEKK